MHILEMQELAGAALGLTEDQTEEILNADEDFDTPLLEKIGVDFEQFCSVAEALIKLTPMLHSTEKTYILKDVKGFVRNDERKQEVIPLSDDAIHFRNQCDRLIRLVRQLEVPPAPKAARHLIIRLKYLADEMINQDK